MTPSVARGRTHLVVGYVHTGYERLITVVAREVGYDSALVVRGIEGGVIPSLSSQSQMTSYRNQGAEDTWKLAPKDAGVESTIRAVPIASASEHADAAFDEASQERDLSSLVAQAAEAGLDALRGKPGPTRESLVLASAMILRQIGRAETLREAADSARQAIDSGQAAARFLSHARRF